MLLYLCLDSSQPEDIAESIAQETTQALHTLVVEFLRGPLRRAVTLRELDFVLRAHIKVWRLGERVARPPHPRRALELCGGARLARGVRTHFERSMERFSEDEDVPLAVRARMRMPGPSPQTKTRTRISALAKVSNRNGGQVLAARKLTKGLLRPRSFIGTLACHECRQRQGIAYCGGTLVDCDLSETIKQDHALPFMAGDLDLGQRPRRHTFAHDLESFFCVIVWVVLRLLTHVKPSWHEGLRLYFTTGGIRKMIWLTSPITLSEFQIPGNPALVELVTEWKEIFATRHPSRAEPETATPGVNPTLFLLYSQRNNPDR